MFYIIVEDKGERKIITTSNGQIRKFSTSKKARNFIAGREYLEAKNPQIVTEIDEIDNYYRVDL